MRRDSTGSDSLASLLDLWLWPLTATRALVNMAPQFLSQPILPNLNLGTVYNVTPENSSAPQTEVEVLSRHSYGRQLGRINDVLSALTRSEVLDVEKLPKGDQESIEEFKKLAKDIAEIKQRGLLKRTEHLAEELGRLRLVDERAFARAAKLLEPVTGKQS